MDCQFHAGLEAIFVREGELRKTRGRRSLQLGGTTQIRLKRANSIAAPVVPRRLGATGGKHDEQGSQTDQEAGHAQLSDDNAAIDLLPGTRRRNDAAGYGFRAGHQHHVDGVSL